MFRLILVSIVVAVLSGCSAMTPVNWGATGLLLIVPDSEPKPESLPPIPEPGVETHWSEDAARIRKERGIE